MRAWCVTRAYSRSKLRDRRYTFTMKISARRKVPPAHGNRCIRLRVQRHRRRLWRCRGDRCARDFESMVREALRPRAIKWIGDEAMLSFPEPETAIQAVGTCCRHAGMSRACRSPGGLNHGRSRRAGDLLDRPYIAARIASLASPGQLLATQPIAEAAAASGILVKDLGKVALRSVAEEVALYEIELAPSPDPAWIDPVCKMHAPYASYRRAVPEGPWFCSPRCEEAYRKSPQTLSAALG